PPLRGRTGSPRGGAATLRRGEARRSAGGSLQPGGDEHGHREAIADGALDLAGLDPEPVVVERGPDHRPDHVGVARLRERAREEAFELPFQPVRRRPRLGEPDRAEQAGQPGRRPGPDVGRVAQPLHPVEGVGVLGGGRAVDDGHATPGRHTRPISATTARGSRKWWKAKRAVTSEKAASGYGSGSTSPSRQLTLDSPRSSWRAR